MATLSKGKIQKQYAEIVFLDYAGKNPSISDGSFPTYMKEELQIGNARSYAQKLVRAGYLQENGRKYTVTDKGQAALEEYQDYLRFFRLATPYITIWDYAAEKDRDPQRTFPAVMTDLFQKKLSGQKDCADDGAVKDIHLDLGMLYEEQLLYPEALEHYLTVLYYDVAGLEYADSLDKYIKRKISRDKARKSYDGVYLRPEARAGIKRMKDAYIPELVERIYTEHPVANHLCSKESFVRLAQEVMGEEALDEKAWQGYFTTSFTAVLAEAEKHRVPAKK